MSLHEIDASILEELYSNLMDKVAELAHLVDIDKQRLLFSTDVQIARLRDAVGKAQMVNQYKGDGTHINAVHEFVNAVEAGSKVQPAIRPGEEAEDTLRGEYYNMITPIGAADASWDLKDVLLAQASDKFCATMMYYLKEGKLPSEVVEALVDDDSDYEDEEDEPVRAKSSTTLEAKAARKTTTMITVLAPHFTVASSGLLLRLHQRNGFKHQELA